MNKTEFSKISLRDLGILITMVEEGRIAPAAYKFGMSASAVSYAIERLRSALNEELLIRTSHGFRATEFGKKYAQKARQFLEEMDHIQEQKVFDPTQSDRHFKIVATDYEISIFLHDVIKEILYEFPKISIQIVENSSKIKTNSLFNTVDLLFSPIQISDSGILQEFLFSDPYVTFSSEKFSTHPLTIEAFCAARHAVMASGDNTKSNIDDNLAKHGKARHIAFSSPSFFNLSQIMRGDNLITTLPSKLAQTVFHDFHAAPPPLSIKPLNLYLTYAITRQNDAGFEWLKKRILHKIHAQTQSTGG